MNKRKTFPVNLRNEDDETLLKQYLQLCKTNSTDGSTEIRRFMSTYISTNASSNSTLSKHAKTSKKTENLSSNIITEDINENTQSTLTKGSYYPNVNEYLSKINYVPSYLKNRNK